MLSPRPDQKYILFIVYFAFHFAVFQHFGAQFVDDAYITFRYAERMAAGLGFTYNDNIPVLGTTTPLWTFLIACCFLLKIPLEIGIALLTSCAAACMCFAIWLILSRQGQLLLGILGGVSLMMYERYLFGFLMGMESIAYVAVVFMVLAMLLDERYRGIGFLCAMACLIRPDGLVLTIIGIAAIAQRSPRIALRESLFFILTLIPWVVFCLAAFGSIVPHSIAAKQLIHPSQPIDAALAPWAILLKDRFFLYASILALPALIWTVTKRKKAVLLVIWTAAYGLGFGASRIQVGLFPWYFVPLISAIWLLALNGAGLISQAMHSIALRPAVCGAGGHLWRRQILPIVLLVAVLTLSRGFLMRNWREFSTAFIAKERYYESAARDLSKQIRRGESVFVGEVGVFGYFLKEASIIDSSGINSPEVYAIRKQSPSGSENSGEGAIPEWALECVKRLQPDWVISLPQFLGARAMWVHREWIPQYEAAGTDQTNPMPNQLVVLKRTDTERKVR